eukprot:m.39753 g.39753  ORF g.39753 m.39753 type:complete len:146 (-) comp8000_c0_seq2:334-771(-)
MRPPHGGALAVAVIGGPRGPNYFKEIATTIVPALRTCQAVCQAAHRSPLRCFLAVCRHAVDRSKHITDTPASKLANILLTRGAKKYTPPAVANHRSTVCAGPASRSSDVPSRRSASATAEKTPTARNNDWPVGSFTRPYARPTPE